MKIVYVVGIALGELAQGKAIAFFAREKGDENIFIAKEPKLISAITGDGFRAIPTKDTSSTRKIIRELEPDVVFLCNSKSVSIDQDPILNKPPCSPRPLVCSLDSNWLFSRDKRSYFTAPPWIDRIYVVMPEKIYLMGLEENGGHYKIPKLFRRKILPSGFVPSGGKIGSETKRAVRSKLKIGRGEKLIFIYFGFLEELYAPVFLPVFEEVVNKFRKEGKKIRAVYKGSYSRDQEWMIQKKWFETEEEFNNTFSSADLLIQHHGLGTLPKAIYNKVPTICMVPKVKKGIPYYRHSEYFEIEPFAGLDICETLPVDISSRRSISAVHFFVADTKNYPIRDISISEERLSRLLRELLYDKEKIRRMKSAQAENYEEGESRVYEDLTKLVVRKSSGSSPRGYSSA